ncbi:hypothetical protein [Actinophytocola sediminis]
MTYTECGSPHHLDALTSLRELFVNYPIRADMSSIRIVGDGQVLVELRAAEPVVLAAGIVVWQRTLANATTWTWRTGDELHVVTTGRAPERDDLTITVLAGPVPHDCRLDHVLEPGSAETLDAVALYDWLASEITNTPTGAQL